MSAEATLAELKTRGYYRINFRPREYRSDALELSACQDLVQENKVSLRGWDYPHFPKELELNVRDDHYEGWTNWAGYREVWRLYQSEQFIILRALREDWASESMFQDLQLQPGSVLSVIGSLVYELTEACEFLARLHRAGLYGEGAVLRIRLSGTRGRALWIDDRGRVPLLHTYRCDADEITFEKALSASELVVGDPSLAIAAIRHVLDRFGWHNPSDDVVDTLATDYLRRRDRR